MIGQFALLSPESMSATEAAILKMAIARGPATVSVEGVQMLWRIALRNQDADVSRVAMNFLSEYYLKAGGWILSFHSSQK
jgi:hypothetical protein